MELLHRWIGDALSEHLNAGRDDDQRGQSDTDLEPSSRILWAARMADGATLILVDEHPRRLICVAPLAFGTTMLGNVQIAAYLVQIGVLGESANAARRALPNEIKDEFPPSHAEQLVFSWTPTRAAG